AAAPTVIAPAAHSFAVAPAALIVPHTLIAPAVVLRHTFFAPPAVTDVPIVSAQLFDSVILPFNVDGDVNVTSAPLALSTAMFPAAVASASIDVATVCAVIAPPAFSVTAHALMVPAAAPTVIAPAAHSFAVAPAAL